MARSALDSLGDALAATRALLLPFSLARWLRLAVVVFFVGATGVSVPPVNVSLQVEGAALPDLDWTVGGGEGGGVPEPALWVVAAVVGVVLLLGLATLLVASVMEFVFVESLRSETVRVRAFARRHWRRGVRLFAFRLALGLALLALAAPLLLLGARWLLDGSADPAVGFVLLAALSVPALAVAGVVVALVNGFTAAFVVPVMLVSGAGVTDGWRRLWPALRATWQEFGLYAVIAFVLNALVGVALGPVVGVAAVLLGVPAALVALPVWVFLGWSPLAAAVLAVVGLAYVAGLMTVVALALVPAKTYLRYYALFVLGDVAPDYDVIPALRARVRGGPAPGDATG